MATGFFQQLVPGENRSQAKVKIQKSLRQCAVVMATLAKRKQERDDCGVIKS